VKNQWHVIHTKPQKEPLVNRQLEDRGLETYFPFLQYERGYNRGIRVEAFFPHYLFLYIDLQSNAATDLRWLPGVRTILYVDNQPATVPESIIESLRLRLNPLNKRVLRKNEGLFKPGQKVLVAGGPFEGFEAIFQKELNGHERVQVLLKLLGAWTRTEISSNQLKPLSDSIQLPSA
jgi:transcription elongation factor/antiterminator RfaH